MDIPPQANVTVLEGSVSVVLGRREVGTVPWEVPSASA